MSPTRLDGVRVLLTRPRGRNEELAFLLEDEGAEVEALPMLELLPPSDTRPLAAAAEHVSRYRWILFTSPAAAESFHEALREAGTRKGLDRTRIGAVGPKTARALAQLGFSVTTEAADTTGRGLFDALKEDLRPGDEILLPVAEEGRPELREALIDAGFQVTVVAAYRAEAAGVADALKASLLTSPPKVIVLGSPRTAEALLEGLADSAQPVLAEAKLVAIGPTTAAALETLGRPAAEVAERPTSEALVEAVVRAVSGS